MEAARAEARMRVLQSTVNTLLRLGAVNHAENLKHDIQRLRTEWTIQCGPASSQPTAAS